MRGGRQRPHRMQTVLDVECSRGHKVGFVVKLAPDHPRAGQYLPGGGLQFEEPPGGVGSGRLPAYARSAAPTSKFLGRGQRPR